MGHMCLLGTAQILKCSQSDRTLPPSIPVLHGFLLVLTFHHCRHWKPNFAKTWCHLKECRVVCLSLSCGVGCHTLLCFPQTFKTTDWAPVSSQQHPGHLAPCGNCILVGTSPSSKTRGPLIMQQRIGAWGPQGGKEVLGGVREWRATV